MILYICRYGVFCRPNVVIAYKQLSRVHNIVVVDRYNNDIVTVVRYTMVRRNHDYTTRHSSLGRIWRADFEGNAAPPSGVISMAANDERAYYIIVICVPARPLLVYYPCAGLLLLLLLRIGTSLVYNCRFMYLRINTKYLPTLSSSHAECNVIIFGLCTVYTAYSCWWTRQ